MNRPARSCPRRRSDAGGAPCRGTVISFPANSLDRPYPPGGSTDTYSRIIGGKLAEALGQQIVIDNRAGAAGSVGAELAAKAPPDGYTLVLGQDSNMVVGQAVRSKKNYDTLTTLRRFRSWCARRR
jgi:tripartite-type tricarboxylate transporter receptor subunit TctC